MTCWSRVSFTNLNSFNDAIARLMRIRQDIQRLGLSLYCHRNLLQARIMLGVTMQQAVQRLPRSEERAASMAGLVDDARPVLG